MTVVGAAVLTFLGIRLVLTALRLPTPTDSPPQERRRRGLLQWSYLALITNPKALSVYVLVVPGLASQMLSGIRLYAAFATIHTVLMTGWLLLLGLTASRIPGIARSRKVQQGILLAAGLTMVALAINMIF